jgi:hypothetical protein
LVFSAFIQSTNRVSGDGSLDWSAGELSPLLDPRDGLLVASAEGGHSLFA